MHQPLYKNKYIFIKVNKKVNSSSVAEIAFEIAQLIA